MPTNPRSLEITERYRSGMVGLRRRGKAEAKRIWQRVEPADLDGTFDIGAMVMTVSTLQREAARLSSGYLASFVSSEIGEPQSPPPVWVYNRTFNDKPLHQGLRSATIVAKMKIGDGMDPVEATKAARSVLLIDVGLYIDTAARESLRQGMEDDPRIEGYQRAIRGTCAACMGAAEGSMLPPGTPLEIHPDCQCVSEPTVTPRSADEVMASKRMPSFTAEENAALIDYQEGNLMSQYLRGQPTGPYFNEAQTLKQMVRMDDAMERAGPIGEVTQTWRGIRTVDMDVRPAWVDDLMEGRSLRGKTFDDPGFGSTTSLDEVAFESASQTAEGLDEIVFRLTVDPKVKGIDMTRLEGTTYEDQGELLLERGARMVVDHVERKQEPWGWVRYIHAKVLPPE